MSEGAERERQLVHGSPKGVGVAIQRWARAKRVASGNARMLLEERGTGGEASRLCAERMDALREAEEVLAGFSPFVGSTEFPEGSDSSGATGVAKNGGLPTALVGWLEAREDPGCSSCWLSSDRGSKHEGCARKIARYFAAEGSLMEHARQAPGAARI